MDRQTQFLHNLIAESNPGEPAPKPARAKTEMQTKAYDVAKEMRQKKEKAVEEFFKQTCTFKPTVNSSRNAQLLQNRTYKTREVVLTKREEEDRKEREQQQIIKQRNAVFVDKLKSQYKDYLDQSKKPQPAEPETTDSPRARVSNTTSAFTADTGGVSHLIRDAREKALVTQLRLQEEREYRRLEREFMEKHPGMDALTAKKLFRQFHEEELREQAEAAVKRAGAGAESGGKEGGNARPE